MSTENVTPFATKDMEKTQQVKPQTKAGALASLLASPKMKSQFAAALPKHMTAERMVRIVTTEIRKSPALVNCDQNSFLGAVIQCAQLGLEPGNSMGHAYILPYGKQAQLIIGYRGMIDLARRSGQIISIAARTVREDDFFEYEYGLDEDIRHRPSESDGQGRITHVYAVAKLQGGGRQFEVMSAAQVEAVRQQSKAKDSGPWKTHWEEMAKKTVIRRLFKYLPVSVEIQKAVMLDEKADAGVDQENQYVFEGDFEVLEEGAE
ncbi:recombination protein RecT [Pseudomonas typographi]|uniref:Recombination protein RecT n=1 Tax=Pseudomonas typographi TaxID=2715964 RepID=A0ABR7ZAF1_9PSED|nr:recombination protein RecT [Pseudomonas typographi]MBD1555247.1 recombination protein RecT [Pseudomonas typographi]MBD1602273.1 recombination protein RecT [Pseudomonas typographi]